MDYFREIGLIDLYAVGGNGGSLAQRYWSIIPFPNFPNSKQAEIVKLYHRSINLEENKYSTLETYLDNDIRWNKNAGILELDASIKATKTKLNAIIQQIVMDEITEISFDFIKNTD